MTPSHNRLLAWTGALAQWLPGALAATVLALLAAGWLWSGQPGSLDQALRLARPWLPALQQLQWHAPAATLRHGGDLGTITWSGEGWRVQARAARLTWQLDGLWHRQPLQLLMKTQVLQLHDTRPPSTEPPAQPTRLDLPLALQATFDIGALVWGPGTSADTGLRTGPVRGRLTHRTGSHHLVLDELRLAQGRYSLDARLDTSGERHTDIHLQGQIDTDTRLPAMAGLQARGRLSGPLASATATLDAELTLAHPQQANGPRMHLQARLQPWQTQPVQALHLQVRGLDAAALWPDAPHTLLHGEATLTPTPAPERTAGAWRARVDLHNTQTGPINRQRLPVQHLQLNASGDAAQGHLERLRADIGTGHAEASGQWGHHGQTWAARLQLHEVPAHHLHTQLAPARVQGQVQTRRTQPAAVTAWTADVQAQPIPGEEKNKSKQIPTVLRWRHFLLETQVLNGLWNVQRLSALAEGASLQAQGRLDTRAPGFDGQAELQAPGLHSRFQGRLAADGGQGQWSANLHSATPFWNWLLGWPGLKPLLQSVWPGQAPQGSATLQAQWQGHGQAQVQTRGDISAEGLGGQWSANATLSGAPHQPLWQQGTLELHPLSVRLQGRGSGLALQAPQAVRVGWTGEGWEAAPGVLHLSPLEPASATVPLRWTVLRARQKQLHTEGQWGPLPWTTLQAWATALWGPQAVERWGASGDLALTGQWAARWPLSAPAPGTPAQARLQLQHAAGDLRLRWADAPEALPLGLRALSAEVALDTATTPRPQLVGRVAWDSERGGQLRAQARLALDPLTLHPDRQAPVQAELSAQWPHLGLWSALAPPGWRADGRLQAHASLSGTLAQPNWSGELQAQDLQLRSTVDGLAFGQGELRARLSADRLLIDNLTLEGEGGAASGGRLSAQGEARWPEGLRLDARAERLRVSAHPDRRLTVSGPVSAPLARDRLELRGQLAADQALVVLPDETAPTLGSDVVRRHASAAALPAEPVQDWRTDVRLQLALGPRFELRGQGLNTRLEGDLVLSSPPGAPDLRLVGEVRTAQGSYRAWGQTLRISRGVLRFSGPADDPALDILALRPHTLNAPTAWGTGNVEQQVGVVVEGSARQPRVRLYAEPDLPEADKLAWLVLGRPASGVGAEAAVLQQAALALLGRQGRDPASGLAGVLGLDDIGLRGQTQAADGSTQAAALSLGKRLSERLYVAYEHSVQSAVGTVALFYDVSRRLSVRAQAGEHNAIDLIFTLPHH